MNNQLQMPFEHIITIETCLRNEIQESYKRRNKDIFWKNLCKQQIDTLRFVMKNISVEL